MQIVATLLAPMAILLQLVGCKGTQYQMNRLCDEVIELNEDNSYIAVIKYQSLENQRRCTLAIESRFGLVRSVRFQFHNISLYPFGCLEVKQNGGKYSRSTLQIKDFPKYLCDEGEEPHADHSLHPAFDVDHVTRPYFGLIVTYRSSEQPTRNHSFILVVNAITSGERCNFIEHMCNNKRCIPKTLQCHPNNPCGDNSDCTAGTEDEEQFEDSSSLPWFTVVGIVVGCLVGLGVLARCCCGPYNKMQTDNAEETQDPFSYDFTEPYDSDNSSDRDSETSASDRNHSHRNRRICETIPLQKLAHAIPLDVSITECTDGNSTHPLPITIEIQTAVLPISDSRPIHESASVPVAMETYMDSEDPPPSYDEVMSSTHMYKTA